MNEYKTKSFYKVFVEKQTQLPNAVFEAPATSCDPTNPSLCCPSGSTQATNNSQWCCPQNQPYYVAGSGYCCDRTNDIISNQWCCPSGSQYDITSKKCICPQNRTYNPTTNACEGLKQCPSGTSTAMDLNGRYYNKLCCPQNTVYDGNTTCNIVPPSFPRPSGLDLTMNQPALIAQTFGPTYPVIKLE